MVDESRHAKINKNYFSKTTFVGNLWIRTAIDFCKIYLVGHLWIRAAMIHLSKIFNYLFLYVCADILWRFQFGVLPPLEHSRHHKKCFTIYKIPLVRKCSSNEIKELQSYSQQFILFIQFIILDIISGAPSPKVKQRLPQLSQWSHVSSETQLCSGIEHLASQSPAVQTKLVFCNQHLISRSMNRFLIQRFE